jgi:hypothetical protein
VALTARKALKAILEKRAIRAIRVFRAFKVLPDPEASAAPKVFRVLRDLKVWLARRARLAQSVRKASVESAVSPVRQAPRVIRETLRRH